MYLSHRQTLYFITMIDYYRMLDSKEYQVPSAHTVNSLALWIVGHMGESLTHSLTHSLT